LEENPKLKKLEQFIQGENGKLISFMAKHLETDKEIEDYVKQQQIPGEIRIVALKSTNSILNEMDINSFPFYLVIDEENKIIFRSDTDNQSVHRFLFDTLSK